MQSVVQKIVIDTDCGFDDLLSIAHLIYLQQENRIRIKGITISNGNIPAQQAAKAVCMVFDMMQTRLPPIFMPTSEEVDGADAYYGLDGCYGQIIESERYPSNAIPVQHRSAERFLFDLLMKEAPDTVVIFVLGPLTNLYLSQQTFGEEGDSFLQRAKHILIMGGNIHVHGNDPNHNFESEFNFGYNPTAAKEVLQSTPDNIIMFPLDTDIAFNKNILDESIAKTNNHLIKEAYKLFLKQIGQCSNGKEFEADDHGNMTYVKLYDPMTTVWFQNPKLFKIEKTSLEVNAISGALKPLTSTESIEIHWVAIPKNEDRYATFDAISQNLQDALESIKALGSDYETIRE